MTISRNTMIVAGMRKILYTLSLVSGFTGLLGSSRAECVIHQRMRMTSTNRLGGCRQQLRVLIGSGFVKYEPRHQVHFLRRVLSGALLYTRHPDSTCFLHDLMNFY